MNILALVRLKRKTCQKVLNTSQQLIAIKQWKRKLKKIVVDEFDNDMDDYANNCSIWCQWGNEGNYKLNGMVVYTFVVI